MKQDMILVVRQAMDKTHVLLRASSHIWLFPLATYSDKWWGAVHSEVEVRGLRVVAARGGAG